MSRKFFQLIAIVSSFFFISTACGLPLGISQPTQMGTIRIVNFHVRGSDFFLGGKNLPDTREYGVCIIAYPPALPAGFIKPTFDMILAKDSQMTQTTNYALPAGTYTLQEWQFDSEINQDPMYSPAFKTLVRPPETITLEVDQILTFGSERSLSAPGEFIEGNLTNPACLGAWQQPGGLPPTDTPEIATDTPEAGPDSSGTDTGIWVLRLIEPNVGKSETQFSYPGLACSGGTTVYSDETSATITTTGTCQIKDAVVADEVTQHAWDRPPDQLTPGEEMTGSMTASSSGICGWQNSMTLEACQNSVTTSHAVWQGDGWPGSENAFSYQNLVFGNDYAGTARASNNPTGSFTWTVPDGSTGGKTLVLQFCSSSRGGQVYTNYWYEWVE